ncbi:hypothetical protein DL93DRAFT_1782195 [Clavulina sp. PMI_390]|nr:hypothetical protein DL93DRAFT_1782195 [Clavulina sp. PMI_390]
MKSGAISVSLSYQALHHGPPGMVGYTRLHATLDFQKRRQSSEVIHVAYFLMLLTRCLFSHHILGQNSIVLCCRNFAVYRTCKDQKLCPYSVYILLSYAGVAISLRDSGVGHLFWTALCTRRWLRRVCAAQWIHPPHELFVDHSNQISMGTHPKYGSIARISLKVSPFLPSSLIAIQQCSHSKAWSGIHHCEYSVPFIHLSPPSPGVFHLDHVPYWKISQSSVW